MPATHGYSPALVYRRNRGDGLIHWLGRQTTPNDGSATSWWLLDEPHQRIDWEALAFYASILREAQQEANAGRMIKFRADISRYNNVFDFLDGLLDTNVAGGLCPGKREDILRGGKHKRNEEYWPSGSWNDVDRDNMNSFLWILDTYLKGGKGIIPWYNFALDKNYEEPDSCAAVYPGKRFGMDTALASMRLKAGRKALQLIKYFHAFKKAFGYSDRQLRAYVSSFITFEGEKGISYFEDAGTDLFDYSDNTVEEMKRDMLKRLIVSNAKAHVKRRF